MEEPIQEPGTVRLYHGTTGEAALHILREGFRPLDRDAVLETISGTHALTKSELLAALCYSFVDSLGREDEAFVSFKHTAIDVEFWARIGGEARWEALKAVYVHEHAGTGIDDAAATAWAESAVHTTHIPTVVIVDVPYDLYRTSVHSAPPSFDGWLAQPDFIRLTGIVELQLPIPPELVAGTCQIGRVMRSHDVAAILRVSDSEVRTRVDRGNLPPSDSPVGLELIWWYSTIAPFLPSDHPV